MFESKDGALEKFGNDKVYEFVKEKTLNLLDKQSFASSILTMMNDFPHDKDLNNDFVTVIELFAFAISLNVCIDNADIHTNNRLYQKIQSIEENKKDSFTKETFNQLKREILEASGRDILVPKNLYSSYEEQIAKLSMFIQIFKPELVNIEVDKKDFMYFNDSDLRSVTTGELDSIIKNPNSRYDVILVDINESPKITSIKEVIHLIEPSTIKLNKMIRTDRMILEKMRNYKIVLNKSLLSEKDIKDFEYESRCKVFDAIPPLDDKKEKNPVLNDLLYKLGFDKQIPSGGVKKPVGKLFGIVKDE